VTIRTANGTAREETVRGELGELLRRYDLSRWTFTDDVIIEQGVIPHSHPVLTLNTRTSGDDLLGAYLHEQLHWLLATRWADPAMATAWREVRSRYPDPPGPDSGGTADAESSQLHLLLGALQVDVLSTLIGTGRTQAVIAGLIETGVYPWSYRTVTRDLDPLLDLCDQAGLREP
jgi:hypothetical protein